MITRVCVIVLACSGLTVACKNEHASAANPEQTTRAAAPAQVREVTVPEVSTFIKEKSAVVVDANGTDTRKESGVIPGAVLLTNNQSYSLSELPSDKAKKLVFYCGGTMCRASDKAAEKAVTAGYKDVSVLREGIKGWKSSGQPTDTLRS
jgi:rhodanese-related sulfurtransferase